MVERRRVDGQVSVLGLLLAGGRGSRMGTPKALVRGADGVPWLVSSRAALVDAGCDRVVVVLGAEAPAAAALLDGDPYVVASDWSDGMAASLRTGLEAAQDGDEEVVLIHLVDLPDVGAQVMRRVLRHAAADALVRAGYDGRAGHPVLIGREHWTGLMEDLAGDEGARRYLGRHGSTLVECGDLATGHDIDTPFGHEETP